MSKEFKLPDLGEGIEEGDVVNVLVSEGDTISAEQTVIEIETDKAVVEVPCSIAGKVSKVHVKQGDKARVGSTLLTLEADGDDSDDAGSEKKEASKKPPRDRKKDKDGKDEDGSGKTDAKKPARKKKEPPKEDDADEPEDDADEPAGRDDEADGEDEDAEDDDRGRRKKKDKAGAAASRSARPSAKERGDDGKPVPAGPATRRLARELGVDLHAVATAHPDVRLTEDHVKAFVREEAGRTTGGTKESAGAAPAVSAPPLPDFSEWGEVERVSFSSLQRKTADHLAAAWTMAPHVTQFDEADITALEALRKRYNSSDKGSEVKLTVTAFVVKAVTVALRMFPRFNASLDVENNELVLKRYYHIGLAVDTEAGLIVPVIRDVDRKRLLDLAAEMEKLAERTRRRKVEREELRGGTFTVTNLGGIGGTAFTPIVNYPEVAILGVARGREVPVLRDGALSTKLMLPLCLSYDHRVINGADGARFCRKVVELLEDPQLLLLEG